MAALPAPHAAPPKEAEWVALPCDTEPPELRFALTLKSQVC